jgi:hypothetical protein
MSYDVANVTVDAVSWTPVTPPDNYDSVLIDASAAADTLRVRRDPNVALELSISAGRNELIAADWNRSSGRYRFPVNAPAFYLRLASGAATISFLWA